MHIRHSELVINDHLILVPSLTGNNYSWLSQYYHPHFKYRGTNYQARELIGTH